MEFLKAAKVPAIVGTIGGALTIVAAQGGEPFYPLAYLIYHGGAIVMLGLLVRCCYRLDLGFRQTLLRLTVFLCAPYCGIMLISGAIEMLKPDRYFQSSVEDFLLVTGLLAGTSLVVSIVTAYFYGLHRLWRKTRREKAIAASIRQRLETRRQVT